MTKQKPAWWDAFENSADDPLLFVTGVLGLPDKWDGCPTCGAETTKEVGQRRVSTCRCPGVEPWQHNALVDVGKGLKDVAIRSGHGVGKTTLFAWLVLWVICTKHEARVPVVSNSQDQLRQTIWPEIRKWRLKLPKEMQDFVDVQEESVRNTLTMGAEAQGQASGEETSGCFAVARTASKDNPEALQGFHAEFVLFLIDEASGVPDIVFEIGLGALSTDDNDGSAMFVLAGNPTRSSGYFFNAFHKSRGSYFTHHVDCHDVQRATGHIEKVKREYGQDSNAWRVRVLGEFPTAADETIISLELAESAVGRQVEMNKVMPVWGLDVARFGSDKSALAKRQGNILKEPVKSWRNQDALMLAGKINTEYLLTPDDEKPCAIMIDIIGVGAGVYDICKKEMKLPAIGVNVGEAAASRENCMRLRDELWYLGREWFQSRAVSMPKDDELIAELVGVTYTFTVTGKFVAESKKDMKKRGVESPDLADAFLLTFAGPTRRLKDHTSKRWETSNRPKSNWAA